MECFNDNNGNKINQIKFIHEKEEKRGIRQTSLKSTGKEMDLG